MPAYCNWDNLVTSFFNVLDDQMSKIDKAIYQYKLALPGYGKEDIEASILNDTVIISDIKTKEKLALFMIPKDADINTIKIKIDTFYISTNSF